MLVQVMMLMAIVIYFYSLWAFATRRADFDEDAYGEFCTSSWVCFMSSLKYGLVYGGGLGEALIAGGDAGKPGFRTIFDISYFMIIICISLSVVFGIIVDSFSELRDEKFQRRGQLESECFICTIKNFEFEQRASGFQDHCTMDHHMWNYLFYMIYLMEKDPTTFSSHEHYVALVLEEDSDVASFFPINRALSLQDSPNQGLETRLDDLFRMVDGIAKRLDVLSQKDEWKMKQRRHEEFVQRAKQSGGQYSPRDSPPTIGGGPGDKTTLRRQQPPLPTAGAMPVMRRQGTTFLE